MTHAYTCIEAHNLCRRASSASQHHVTAFNLHVSEIGRCSGLYKQQSAYACMPAGPNGELPEALQKLEPAILELVCNEIVERGGHVQWSDIAGQEQAKRLVQELVVWPMLNPHLFKVSPLLAILSR